MWIDPATPELPPDRVQVLVWLLATTEIRAGYELAYRYNGDWYFGEVDDDFATVVEEPWVIARWSWLIPPPVLPFQASPLN